MAVLPRSVPAIAALAVAGLVAAVPAPVHAALPAQTLAQAPAQAPAALAKTGKDLSVTLITGDKVLLPGGDVGKASIQPAAGRENIGFNTYRFKGHAYVVPADVARDIGVGRIDRRLFDVAQLVRDGYDDASTGTIPVLTTYAKAAKRSVPEGTKLVRQLAAIGGAALRVDKPDAKTFLQTAGFSKLWLDGKRKLTLDQSVPQIGGPVAWQAGYTGKGVSVAVLDSGVDATHPDLATQLAGEKNFTSESTADLVGHGTHVASTIAGTGAASGGKYKGVAPDAKIYDGKICGLDGCPDSAILAGMEWAAKDVKAKIVNLSVGGADTPEVDPLEEAVNRLTAETGTLFVVSAGNDGPGDGTINSPGSADAALTVGNVTKQDALNELSSRGPRLGDSALKPDVTAPGTDIVAAKSKDSSIGEPVGDKYLKLSGTSMATPHTAGAAALLLQEHPSWKPADLKSALMGSAKIAADQTSFQQGAGRIDLTKAIKQTVVAEPGSVSFGKALFPHTDDKPVTRPVTFHNLGTAPVTLALTSVFSAPDGSPAPAGAFKLSADSVQVPAGGTASVQATSDTTLGGADGLYSGRITATGGGQTVTVPIGLDKEGPTYNLKVKLIRPDGKPDKQYPVTAFGIDNASSNDYTPDATGTATLRLPQGEYMLDQFQEFERKKDDWVFYKLLAPSVKLTSDRTIVLDARKAKPVSVTVPTAGAALANLDIGYNRKIGADYRDGSTTATALNQVYTYSTGPTLSPKELVGRITSQWGVPGADGRFTNTPYLYGTADFKPGAVVTGFNRKAKLSDFAVVDQTVHATDAKVFKTMAPELIGGDTGWARVIGLDAPRSIRYYLDQTAYGWSGAVQQDITGKPVPFPDWTIESPATRYQVGRHYQERWNAAVFGPAVRRIARTSDWLGIVIASLTDADGHLGGVRMQSASTKLYRGGTIVSNSDSFGTVDAKDLPAGKTTYRLVTTGTQKLVPFSTRIDLEATFSSAADQQEIALHTVAFRPDVDGKNTVARKPMTSIPFEVAGGPVTKVTVEYSDNGGSTWKKAEVKGKTATFTTPAGKTVSLRSTATDAAGNTTTQTVITAYNLR
ncbi:S8 family serine peptidase [Kribbella solani]|uniref:Subtilisin family serine protease n=1 Tax=Kribbella solani TaxID=236067 RepID=A0A841DVG3_9ACTN|nr:subtilisin family serine protease [Kribbella solani]